MHARCSLSRMYRGKRTMHYRSLNVPPQAHRVEKCVKFAIPSEWPVQKLSKRILDDWPKSESDSDIFGGPKISDSDLHL